MHARREQILRLVEVLTGLPTTGAQVHESQVYALQAFDDEDDPISAAIVVRPDQESHSEESSSFDDDGIARELDAEVVLVARSPELRDQASEEVEARLRSLPQIYRLTEGISFSDAGEGEIPYFTAAYTVRINY